MILTRGRRLAVALLASLFTVSTALAPVSAQFSGGGTPSLILGSVAPTDGTGVSGQEYLDYTSHTRWLNVAGHWLPEGSFNPSTAVALAPYTGPTEVQHVLVHSGSTGGATTVALASAPTPGNTVVILVAKSVYSGHAADLTCATLGMTPGVSYEHIVANDSLLACTQLVTRGNVAALRSLSITYVDGLFAYLAEVTGNVTLEGYSGTDGSGATSASIPLQASASNALRYIAFLADGSGSGGGALLTASPGAVLAKMDGPNYQNGGVASVPTAATGSQAVTFSPNGGTQGYMGINLYAAAAPAVATPAATPTATGFTSGSPNIYAVFDPQSPVTTAALTAGVAGNQVDASGNLLAATGPVGAIAVHGYGEMSLVQAAGGVLAHYHGDSNSYNNAYDALTVADPTGFVGPAGESYCLLAAMTRNAAGSNETLAYDTPSVNHLLQATGSDGALHVEQNNGAAGGTEASGPLTALGLKQVVTECTDGTRFYLFRGRTLVLTTPVGTIGGLSGVTKSVLFNNPQADVWYAELIKGMPSAANLNTYVAAIEAHVGITGDTATVNGTPTTDTPWIAPPTAAQIFDNFSVAAIRPTLADPVDPSAKPVGWPASDAANLVNYASFVFGSSSTNEMGQAPNITTDAAVHQHVESNQINGTAGLNYSNDNAKQANIGNFSSEFRVYPDGDIHQTVKMTPQGLQLLAICAANRGAGCTGQAGVVSGMVRPETAVRPGDIGEVCERVPGAAFIAAWPTVWLTGGWYPAANDNTPFYAAATKYPRRLNNYLEIDWPDHAPLNDGHAANDNLSLALVTALNDATNSQRQGLVSTDGGQSYHPKVNYLANGGAFSPNTNQGVNLSVDLSLAPHCVQVELVDSVFSDPATRTTPTALGHVIYSFDGVEYKDDTYAFAATNVGYDGSALTDGSDPRPVLSPMVSLQYGPGFDPNATAAMVPATVNNATMVISSIRFWHRTGGAHVAPTLANAAQ